MMAVNRNLGSPPFPRLALEENLLLIVETENNQPQSHRGKGKSVVSPDGEHFKDMLRSRVISW